MWLLLISIIVLGSFNCLCADLRNPELQSNYLIIYHEEYKDDIIDFHKWRETKGYKVTSVNLTDIVNEFPSDNKFDTTKAIQNFTEYIIENWANPKLEYLLLIGSINHIPSVKIESFFHGSTFILEDSVHTDVYYTMIPAKSLREYYFAIGRFPARNRNELVSMFSKTYLYEDNYRKINFSKDVIHVTDLEDSVIFNKFSRALLNYYPNSNRTLRLPFVTEKSLEEFRYDFINALSEGTSFLGYIGHGHQFKWSRSIIIDTEFLDTLSVKSPPFIFYSLSCSHSFDDPEKKSIVEQLISKEDFGAVATVSSSAVTYDAINGFYLEKFLQAFITGDDVTIGSSMTKVRTGNPYFDNIMNLMGDPALKVPYYIIASVYDEINQDDVLIYPNPAIESITIQVNIHPFEHLSIMDINGKEIKNHLVGSNNILTINVNELQSGTYFIKMNQGDKLVLKKFIKL
ncbi:MAG: T9SS type A sorting domain-containing protein [Ignavibacteriae bacterium]|nr:T9SS type A sorting domain-containing protein [Ignavibacteriota bacterium]